MTTLAQRNNCPETSLLEEVSPAVPTSREKAYMQIHCLYEKMFDGAQVDDAYNENGSPMFQFY